MWSSPSARGSGSVLPRYSTAAKYQKGDKPWTYRRAVSTFQRRRVAFMVSASIIVFLLFTFTSLLISPSTPDTTVIQTQSDDADADTNVALNQQQAVPSLVNQRDDNLPNKDALHKLGKKRVQDEKKGKDDAEQRRRKKKKIKDAEATDEEREKGTDEADDHTEAAVTSEGSADIARQDAVRAEFIHAWSAYKEHAWGFDDLHPVSRTGTNGYNMGLTLIDSLDTLIIMGLDDDYERCRQWIKAELVFKDQKDVNVFETTIRVLGGLLSGYSLKKEPVFLEKAVELADLLLCAFDTGSGIPFGTVSFSPNRAYNPTWSGGVSTTSEAGSIQLEFRYLSHLTHDPVYREKVDMASAALARMRKPKGLFTRFVNPESGALFDSTITLGARVDSIYEYFLKQWLQSGRTDAFQKRLYDEHVDAILRELLVYSRPSHMAYFQEIYGSTTRAKMDHLVCFMPGMLALGAANDPDRKGDMEIAEQLMRTCVRAYTSTATGLAPEIMLFHNDGDGGEEVAVDPGAKHNLLRPETLESLFVMWRITHERRYRDWGWAIFEAFKQHCRLPDSGYSGLRDVQDTNDARNWNDHMESFFLGETLKYAYLLFSDDSLMPLDEWVFNTEAHAFPILNAHPVPANPIQDRTPAAS